MSDAANWSRVRDLFSRALDLEPPLRAAFLREACGGDSVLHAEVSSLLAAHADAGSIAEGSPLDALDASAVSSLLHGLRAGDRLGPYDIVGPLGAGGMGEVYEARDTPAWPPRRDQDPVRGIGARCIRPRPPGA